MPHTSANESGFWQPPVADDAVDREKGKWNSRGEPKLSAQVMKWPTPCARDHFPPHTQAYIDAKKAQGHGMSNLTDAVHHFPTPTATQHKGWSANHNRADTDDRLDYTIEREAANCSQPGRLNPTWVEWLMGWPSEWTDLKPLAMDKYQEWQRQHGCF